MIPQFVCVRGQRISSNLYSFYYFDARIGVYLNFKTEPFHSYVLANGIHN